MSTNIFDISTSNVLPASTSSKVFRFGLVGDPSGYQLFNSYHYYNISLFLNIITLTLKNRSVSMGYEVFYEYAAEPKKDKLNLKFP